MQVDFIKSKKDWEKFIIANDGSFLQSNFWHDFKKQYQDRYQLEVRENNKIIGLCQFFKEKTPFGNYFYVPHGPVCRKKEVTNLLFEKIIEVGEKENIVFIKIEPLHNIDIGVKSFSRIQPQKTLILDIDKNNDEILQSFNSGTRRNINIAIKNGIIVKEEKNVDYFFNLLLKTKNRQKFNSYNKEYFINLLEKTPSLLFCAYYKKSIIATNIVFYYGKKAYCLHSASDYDFRNLKGANLLRYQSIIRARNLGLTKFDNWGIDEKRFPGVTNFKKGFGGTEFIYPPGKDIVLKNKNYNLYKFFYLLKKRRS